MRKKMEVWHEIGPDQRTRLKKLWKRRFKGSTDDEDWKWYHVEKAKSPDENWIWIHVRDKDENLMRKWTVSIAEVWSDDAFLLIKDDYPEEGFSSPVSPSIEEPFQK